MFLCFFDLNSCVKLHGLLKLVFGERLESLLWKWIFLNWGVFSSNGNSAVTAIHTRIFYILVYNLLHISIFFLFSFMCFFFNFNIACTFDDAFDFDVNRSLSGFINQISSTKLYNRILCVFPLIYWFLLGFWTYINQILELISLWFKCLFCMENETKKTELEKFLFPQNLFEKKIEEC